MASVGTTAAIHRTFASQHFTKKPSTQARIARSLGTTRATNSSVQGPTLLEKQDKSPLLRSEKLEDEFRHSKNSDERSHPRFYDERWKNGTWALDMFVKQGKMDWDAVIVAEARRRKFLELYPEASSNEEPVLFRTSDIPWWAWMVHSHLPEAELLNGRAAMLGFVIAYIVDAVTGLGLVDQTGNFICKGALLFTIIGVLVFRRKEDVENIRKLVGEATLYDKQWQASWQNVGTSEEQIMKND